MTSETIKPYTPPGIGLPIAKSPYQFNDAKLSILFLKCDSHQIQIQLDKYINIPSDGECDYRALSMNGDCYLFMIMADMQFVASNEQGQAYGTIKYPESSFWIPAFDIKNLNPGLFLPLLLLNNGTAIASGREMYGFEKQQAEFTFLNSTHQLDIKHPNYIMSPYSFTELSKDTLGKFNPLIKVTGDWDETENGETTHLFQNAESIVQKLANHWFPDTFSVEGHDHSIKLDDFFSPEIPLPCIFLKQFPAVENGSISCFQQVTYAPFDLTAINAGGLYWDWSTLSLKQHTVNVYPIASHPIVEQLGLKADKQQDGSYQMLASGLWVDIDFSLQLGK